MAKTKITPRRVRKLRLEMGLTQVAFGKVLGLTARQVSRLESGETPLSRLHQLALTQVGIQEGIDV